MQSELDRSRFAQETLELSTAVLTDLGSRYSDLDSLLSSSRTLLSSLLRSQKSDTWYLETALYILIATIVWLVYRRFLYGPLWWFVWQPLRLFWWLVWQPPRLLYYSIYTLLGTTGLFGTAATTTTIASSSTITRTPLIVKPSATGGLPRFAMSGQRPNVPAGGGGYGAKVRPGEGDPSAQGSMSQQVGQMAEQSQQQAAQQSQAGGEKEVPRRADGQPLQESDAPRNPKKRMWDEDVERAKAEEEQRKRDEL